MRKILTNGGTKMEITKVTSLDENSNDVSNDYLKVNELMEGINYTKIAYVMSSNAGLSKNETGYAKFYLKDANSTVVTAFLFNVQDFALSGLKLSQFKGKPVKISFVPQIYNGRVSLIIDGKEGISYWDGEFDKSIFVGTVNYNEALITKAARSVIPDWEFPAEYRVFTDSGVGQGRVGAFGRVIEMSLRTLAGYSSMVPDGKVLLEVFLAAIDAKYSLLKSAQKYDFLNDAKLFNVIETLTQKYRANENYPVVVDVVRALAGFGKPSHLYSHLVISAIKQAIQALDLIISNDSLIVGSSAEIGGVVLSKY